MQDHVFKSLVGIWPDFPRNGVLFKDINPVLRNNEALNYITEKLCEQLVSNQIDMVAANRISWIHNWISVGHETK